MIEVAFDIASGANYKFNTAAVGEEVRAFYGRRAIRLLEILSFCPAAREVPSSDACSTVFLLNCASRPPEQVDDADDASLIMHLSCLFAFRWHWRSWPLPSLTNTP